MMARRMRFGEVNRLSDAIGGKLMQLRSTFASQMGHASYKYL